MIATANRPPIESLACINPECDHYAQPNQGNLKIRKIYGADQIRYLRCTHCGTEFSERKHTALIAYNLSLRSSNYTAMNPRGVVG